ncbi:MAG: rhomboid family intramembrane serine protease [Candidatus Izemoplasmatales bacterium]
MWQWILRNSKRAPITFGLICANLIMLIATIVTGGFDTMNLVGLGGLVPAYVTQNHEYYRMIATIFLHGGIFHFLMNMFALYVLGTALEQGLGTWRYLLIYFVAGIGSSLAVVLFSDAYTLSIGASGAIYGVMGALLYITFARREWFTPRSVQSIRSMMLLNIAITFLVPMISIAGHLGGLFFGVVITILLLPNEPIFRKRMRRFDHGRETVGDGDPTILS